MDRVVGEMVGRAVGGRVVRWRAVERGYTPAERWVVELAGGGSAFVKAARGAFAEELRREAGVYAGLPAGIAPEVLAWIDDDERPMLVLEDLSAAVWPPPWDERSVGSVRRALDALAAIEPPAGVGRVVDGPLGAELGHNWELVAADPGPFLSLGIADRAWVDDAVPALLEAERAAQLDGENFLHLDVRSDNLCFVGGSVRLIDWNHAGIGNPVLDLAAWLPSLHAEGGPEPSSILAGEPGLAAMIAGYFAARAGSPPGSPSMVAVRALQRRQLVTALPWACETVGVPAPRTRGTLA